MKLDWRKTFLIGLGFFGISVVWQLYNSFVPIFLQAGRPDFETTRNVLGFGLSKQATGIVMGLDNVAAIFILPLIGVWSDRVRTRIGRRYPFIAIAAPLAIIGFVLLPLATRGIMPATSGDIGANQSAFIMFMVGAVVLLLAMAVMRTPIVSLMPDLTPSPLRSKANGVINLMGGLGVIIASFGLARLFDASPLYPFIVGALIMAGALLLLFFSVKEPRVEDLSAGAAHEESDQEQALRGLRGFSAVPTAYRRSLLFLLVAIFCWFVAYDGVSTFFTSYAVDELGVSEGFAPTLFGVAGLSFLIFAIPAGFVGERLGRRRTITLGLTIFAVLLVAGFFLNSPTLIGVVLGLGGLGWALVNINSLPMVVDTIDDERLVGTFTGLYYLASQTGSALAPFLTATVVEALGGSYRNIFLSGPLFFALAIAAMLFVTRGEAHQSEIVPAATD